MIQHSDHGGQYLATRYIERLAKAGIEPSVGSVGDSFDNTPSQDRARAVQDRGHPPTWSLALHDDGEFLVLE